MRRAHHLCTLHALSANDKYIASNSPFPNPLAERRVSIQVLCPAHPKIVCVYIAPEDPNGLLHDDTDLDTADLDAIVSLVLWLLVAHLLLGLVVLLLLLLPTVLHLLLLARVTARHRVRSGMVRLAVLRVLGLVLVVVVVVRHLRRSVAARLQLDVYATFIVLSVVLQSEFTADLLEHEEGTSSCSGTRSPRT